MQFIEPKLSVFSEKLAQLSNESKALWGEMSVQRMVEHLSDSLTLSIREHEFKQSIPDDKVERAQAFLQTEHPMPKNFKVEFATVDTPVRNTDLNSAITEFESSWGEFENYFSSNPDNTTLHPSFGRLNYEQWLKLHSKHFTHHLEQFGV